MLVGAVLLRLTFTDTYARYVQRGMGTWLIVAGIAIILVGLVDAHSGASPRASRRRRTVTITTTRTTSASAGCCSRRSRRSCWSRRRRSAATASSARRTSTSAPERRSSTPLKRGAGPAPMTLLEFGQRAFEHDGASFNGVPVQLTGFVAGGGRRRLPARALPDRLLRSRREADGRARARYVRDPSAQRHVGDGDRHVSGKHQ